MAQAPASVIAAQAASLAAQYEAEVVAVAAELRTLRPHSDPGAFLALTRRYEDLRRAIPVLKSYGAAA